MAPLNHGQQIKLLEPAYFYDFRSRRVRLNKLVYKSDETCIEQLQMSVFSFKILCALLQTKGGLRDTENMLVDEQVAIFLHVLAHSAKNSVIEFRFRDSGETISNYFLHVLKSVLRVHKDLLKLPEPISDDCTNETWKPFKNCLGALDGTFVNVIVPNDDKQRYRNHNGEIVQNVLAACSPDEQFIYVLTGWEGSAADNRVLQDAMTRSSGLKVPSGHYYLVDGGYTNGEGFLAPYKGRRYYLNEWGDGYCPSNTEEHFNLKHSSARDVIDRCFGQLKSRWAILRNPIFYPIGIQTNIILACCLLHNHIKQSMSFDPLGDDFKLDTERESDSDVEISDAWLAFRDDMADIPTSISAVETSDAWTAFRDNLANEMFSE